MIFHLLVGVANSGSLINVRLLQLHVLKSITLSRLNMYSQNMHTICINLCVWLLRSAQAGKNPLLMQDTLATSCSPLAVQGKAHCCKMNMYKIQMKNTNFCFDSWPLEFSKVLVPGMGTAWALQPWYSDFLCLHMHTHRGLTQELAAVLGLQASTVSGLSSCWLHRCLNPPNSEFPVPVDTWIPYTPVHVEYRDTHTHPPASWEILEVEFNKKMGWTGGEVQSVARRVFLTYHWPFFSSFCSLNPCFSSAWCLGAFPFPAFWFLL